MCGISVAVCVKAMKQLVFYVSSPCTDSWVVAGALLTYSSRGPSLQCSGVSQAKQFQASCKGRNLDIQILTRMERLFFASQDLSVE